MSPRQPPFDRWPLDHFNPSYGYAWYCGGGLIVSHITLTCGSASAAHAYHDYESRILREHATEIADSGGLFVIHDWRSMETYDGKARSVWQERMQQRPKGYLKGAIVCVTKAGPLLRMAVQAANLVATLTQGAKVELSEDLMGVLRKYDPRPAGSPLGTSRL